MQRAHYDNEGNIILESTSPKETVFRVEIADEPTVILVETRQATWTVLPEMPSVTMESSPAVKQKTRKQSDVKAIISKPLAEGTRQFNETALSAKKGFIDLATEIQALPVRVRGSMKRMWSFASSPLTFPRGKHKKKSQTKVTLFMKDTVRFGGTFALIFSLLFVGVNYQSFFQIARAQLALGDDIQTEEALQNMAQGNNSTSNIRSAAGSSEQNILKYLPAVGPYEDRLIIPKLGKNIPIVRPSMDALIREDWKQFETDIQESLHDGVVHYPGSARPGQAGNFFVTGHSSYYPWDDGKYKDVFARLHELNVGDTYFVYYGGDKHTYRITEKYEVKPSDVTVLDQPSNKRLSTLMTCTPIGTTLRRLIVLSEEIDPVNGQVMQVGEKTDESSNKPFTRLEALPI